MQTGIGGLMQTMVLDDVPQGPSLREQSFKET